MRIIAASLSRSVPPLFTSVRAASANSSCCVMGRQLESFAFRLRGLYS